jgi:hypothetical protein
LYQVHPALNASQKVLTSGGFEGDQKSKCFSVCKCDSVPKEETTLHSNAEETDLRIWLHCKHSTGSHKLIYSKDTDIYHIGLTLASEHTNVLVQQSDVISGEKSRFISLQNLQKALHTDRDLSCVPHDDRAQALQTIYVCTGCDYISFFKGISKNFFLTTFFQHSNFISSGCAETPGTLADVHFGAHKHGFLAFLRLVGTAYFKKHPSAFHCSRPDALYYSVQSSCIEETHALWLNKIRDTKWDRVINEEHALPSYDALELHWMRSVWVLNYWNKATDNEIVMPG